MGKVSTINLVSLSSILIELLLRYPMLEAL